MKKLEFPLLTKDDIELRIGQVSKDGTKATLLLYQDARCGMKYLDQVVGPANWQKKYYEVRSLVLCSLGIYDEDRNEWTWKDDTGTAGSIEEEKSIISDSFKRCCVCWGLARELYTAPTIWVKYESKYDKFKVVSISYNQDREIKSLEIANEKGEIVYSYGMGKNYSQNANKPQKKDILEQASNGIADTFEQVDTIVDPLSEEDKNYLQAYVGNLSANDYKSFFDWLKRKYNVSNIIDLNAEQGRKITYYLKNRNK